MAATDARGEGADMVDTEKRPVLMGLVALATVALMIGLLGGTAMLVGVKALGLDGGSAGGSSEEGSSGTLYLPKPTYTPTTPAATESEPAPEASASETLAAAISLSA